MRTLRHLATFLLLAAQVASACAAEPSAALPRSAPEAQGIASSAVLAFITAADQDVDGMHSFMLLRHGQVVAEAWWKPYDAQTPHMFYSLSKSFTSTAVGMAIAEGKLSIDDEVLKAFPEDAPAEPSANFKRMRVRDLLRMATGHQNEAPLWVDQPGAAPETWVHRFMNQPVAFKPGTRFLYDTPATYMLSALVQKATGQSLLEYLKPRLFQPLGFGDVTWFASPQGISAGGFGLMARTEEIARFGQLYLQKGAWNGKQLLPAAWVDEATTLQIANGSDPRSDWDQGYCYQFWRCRHHGYRGDGAFGQYCVVLPDSDAVIAITSGVHDMQAVLNLVWDKLLPAMKEAALPADDAAQHALAAKLAGLTMPVPVGKATSPLAAGITGKWFTFPANDRGITAIALDTAATPPALLVRTAAGETRTPYASGSWGPAAAGFANGIEKFLSVPEHPLVAASGAWTADDVFTIKLVACQTPYYSTVTLRFAGDRLTVAGRHNVAFGPTQVAELVGEAAR